MALQVWLPLNGDLKNLGISNSNINLVSDNTWSSSGKIGNNSLILTKLQTILPNSSCMSGAKEMSYAYWVKVNTAWSANWLDGIRWIETNGTTTNTARQEFYNNCTLIGAWYKGGSIYGKTITPGVWTHLAITANYITGEVKFYINGILSGSTSNLDTTYYCRGDFYIGDNGTNICENDIRIYDHCLSAAEVKEIAQGLVLHYTMSPDLTNLTTSIPSTNVYNYPTFNTSNSNGGWSHWGQTGASGHYLQNTDKKYIYNKNNTYSHCHYNDANATGNYLLYQSPSFEGGYRSLSCIVKEENSLPINEDIIYPAWNANATGGVPLNKWTNIIDLGNGFYYCLCEGIRQDGSNDLVGIHIKPGYKVYFSEVYLENNVLKSTSPFIYSSNKLQDSSGYNNNGIVTSTPKITIDTARYSQSMLFDGVDDVISVPYNAVCPENIFTINLWFKKTSLGSKGYETLFGGPSGFEMDARANTSTSLSLYMASTRSGNRNSVTPLTFNKWYMVTMTRNAEKERYYINGIFQSEISAKSMPVGTYYIGAWKTATQQNYYGYISDFRLYNTVLDDTAIKQIYEVSSRIDNTGKVHAYSFDETQDKLNITKTGIFNSKQIAAEAFSKYLKYDPQIYFEPDGSAWVRIYHHNNPATKSFNSTDDFANGVYLDEDRWFNVNFCNYLNKWEFMVKGQHTTDSAFFKMRWQQLYNPMTATFQNVAAANITKITGNGYSNYPSTWGGLYKKQSNAYLTTNNGNSSNWYGAIGCWVIWNGGIPGWGPEGSAVAVVTSTGYNDLYVRIDNVTFTTSNQVSINKNKILIANDFIEI